MNKHTANLVSDLLAVRGWQDDADELLIDVMDTTRGSANKDRVARKLLADVNDLIDEINPYLDDKDKWSPVLWPF